MRFCSDTLGNIRELGSKSISLNPPAGRGNCIRAIEQNQVKRLPIREGNAGVFSLSFHTFPDRPFAVQCGQTRKLRCSMRVASQSQSVAHAGVLFAA
jgi:hypothetical protein